MSNILQNIFSVKNDFVHKVITIFGFKIKIKSKKLQTEILKQQQLERENHLNTHAKNIIDFVASKSCILYFDHSLGGGTETYFYNQLSKLNTNTVLFRVQFFLHNQLYKVTVYDEEEKYEINEIDLELLSKLISKFKFSKVVLNNIVGYPNVNAILDLISDYKKDFPSAEIIMKGHDFYSICPEWNLLNYNNEYCGVETKDCKCKKCFNKFQLKCNDIQKDFTITSWRKMWGDFLYNTVDIIEVFSPSSKDIFSKAYSETKDKIILNPHKIKPFPKYTIGILGAFCVHKGSKIIETLIRYLENNEIYDYNICIIGEVGHNINSDLCFYTGKYSRNNLSVILNNNKIDMILIPSIWHETFSYTTAEAIALGYPVACFDMGGQADQVKQYDKGLILSSFEPEIIEKEMREFLENKEVKA